MVIYDKSGLEIIDIIVDDKSYRYKVIMGENSLTLYFSLPTFIEISEGSYIDFKSERYFLLDPENFTQHHSENYEYTLLLDSYQSLLKLIKFKFFTMADSVVNSPFELKFSLTLTPAGFAQLLVDNMNIGDSSGGWTVGESIVSDPICLDFNHDYCFDVLSKLVASDAFDTEWEIENKILHIRPVEKFKDSPIPLKYGYNCGLIPGTSRVNVSTSKAITRLFIEGSDRNIDKSTYGSSTLRMPKNQTITYKGIAYKTDSSGTYIERVIPTGRVVEDSLDVTKIYPSRTGIVSQVNTVDAAKNLYDIIDSSIPDELDFSKEVISGETMTIVFQTGQLAGKEFNVAYKDTTKRFEIVPTTDNGISYPCESIFPEIGDKYAVFHISLPTDYITTAETDVLNAAVKYLYENESQKYTYTGTLDEIYAKRNWLTIGGFLNCGYFVALRDDQFLNTLVIIRITAVKEFINKPKQPEITLSNEVTGETLGNVLKTIPTQIQATDRKDLEATRNARRQWADVKQTTEMLQSSLLNYSESISPISIKTMQLISGDESLQFDFVSSQDSTAEIPHIESYDSVSKIFRSDAGILQHKTLGITTLSSYHTATEYKWWNMTAYISMVLYVASKSYYLYAKVSKTDHKGVFLLSETAIALESIDGYYHLLVGLLNSENDGDRSYSQMYGYSELTPGRLTTKKIVSPNGQTYFDLENNVIGGNIKFKSGNNYIDVGDGILSAQQAAIDAASADATLKANAAQSEAKGFVDALGVSLQSQIDGNITSFFYDYEPNLTNIPASSWDPDSVRDIHLGDLFYWTTKGFAYRYQKVSSIYSWTLIKDTDVTKALSDAATAQTIANGKRTTYAVQPFTPYLIGDLWLNNGDLYSCNVARSSGLFTLSDWGKPLKYTDDKAANAAQATASNAASSASDALSSAATANNLLSDIANDNKLTPSEKQSTLNEWNIIISEKVKIDAQADSFLVSKIAYGSAYDSLSNYITPLLASLSVTSDIDGSTFRTNFKTYYDARQDILNSISTVAKTIADNAKIAANTAITSASAAQISVSALDYLKTALTGSTDISGGLLATNVLLLKNVVDGLITGGMSGIIGDNIGMWLGGTYQDALNGIAKSIDYKDGSARKANGNLNWDKDGNVVLKGIITALGGKIGGLGIFNNTLMSDSMEFSESNVELLSDLLAPPNITINRSSSSTWMSSSSDSVKARTQLFTLTAQATISFYASFTQASSTKQYTNNIYISDGNDVIVQNILNVIGVNIGLSKTRYTVSLPSGTYRINIEAFQSGYYGMPETLDKTVQIYGDIIDSQIIAYNFVHKTKIGNNGMFSFWDNITYFYYSKIQGLKSKGAKLFLNDSVQLSLTSTSSTSAIIDNIDKYSSFILKYVNTDTVDYNVFMPNPSDLEVGTTNFLIKILITNTYGRLINIYHNSNSVLLDENGNSNDHIAMADGDSIEFQAVLNGSIMSYYRVRTTGCNVH